jgi:hypothetical protein
MPRVRTLLVDHAYRLLLVHVTDGRTSWWEAPLREDTGLTARVGPCVWERRARWRRTERFHVAWLDDPHAPRARVAERERVLGERWWTLDELAHSTERFDPARLPALAPAVVRGEYGATPLDVA